MSSHKAAVLAVLSTLLGLAACDGEVDTGPRQTQTRDVEPFNAIDFEGTARLEIEVGSPESLTVEGRDSSLKRLKTHVENNILIIRGDRRDWISIGRSPRVTLHIAVPHLKALTLQGGNDVLLTGFNGGATKLTLEGATHLKAVGQLASLTVSLVGAGHADLKSLIADDAKITVDGVGSVLVHPKNSLDATMNGVGAILYTGNPREVNTHMNGLGTIARGEAKDLESRRADRKRRDSEDLDVEQPEAPDAEALQPEYEGPKPPKPPKQPFKQPEDESITEVI